MKRMHESLSEWLRRCFQHQRSRTVDAGPRRRQAPDRVLQLASLAAVALLFVAPAQAQGLCDSLAGAVADAAHYRNFGAPPPADDWARLRRLADDPKATHMLRRIIQDGVRAMQWVYAHPTITPEEAVSLGYGVCYGTISVGALPGVDRQPNLEDGQRADDPPRVTLPPQIAEPAVRPSFSCAAARTVLRT